MQHHHFFASTAYNWSVGATRAEAIAKVARDSGADLIKRMVKSNGGLAVASCRVDLPQSTDYSINYYMPEFVMENGEITNPPRPVPREEAQFFLIVNAKGHCIPKD